jgi:hypothetical protein
MHQHVEIALTGGIATGKSLRPRPIPPPRRSLPRRGRARARRRGPGTEATRAIAARFGADVLAADGSVDRRKLGPIVFADGQARRELRPSSIRLYRAIAAGLRGFELIGGSPLADRRRAAAVKPDISRISIASSSRRVRSIRRCSGSSSGD